MKSKTKSALNDQQIQQLVEANFGRTARSAAISELTDGMFNSAYLIEGVADHGSMVLKVSVSPDAPILRYEQDIMATELAVYNLIRENTQVPVPDILASDLSGSLLDQGYFFMSHLQGETLHKREKSIPKGNLDAIKAEVAACMAQIHNIRGDYFGYFTTNQSQQYKTWKDAVYNMYNMILEDGRQRKVKLPYKRIERALNRHAPLLEEICEPRLVDYDLWAGNVFVQKGEDGRYRLEGIVDFERAFWGDPYADYASSIIMLSDIQKEPVFWDSYAAHRQDTCQITDKDLVRINLYKLYLWIIMVVETYRYPAAHGMIQQKISKTLLNRFLSALEKA